MGSTINKLTGVAGIRLFPGGPYPDAGIGDQSMAASKPLQAAGQNFLNLSQGQAGAGNPYAGIMNQMAYESGVQSPFGGGSGGAGGWGPRPSGPVDPLGPWGPLGAATNANQYDASGKYIGGGLNTFGTGGGRAPAQPGAQGMSAPQDNLGGLSGSYASMFSNLKGHVEKARQNALSQLNSHLSARGLGNSTEARAHQAYLNSQFDNHLADTMSQLQGQQHQERLSTLQNFISNLQNFGGLGANMIQGNVQNLNQNAQAATARTNQANAALGSAIGLGLGAGGVYPRNQFQSPFQQQNQSDLVNLGGDLNTPGSAAWYNAYGNNAFSSPFQFKSGTMFYPGGG